MTARMVAVSLMSGFLLVGCDALPASKDRGADGPAAAVTNGRYVFYQERGFLLDTATGDMWAMNPGEEPKLAPVPKTKVRYYNPATGKLQDSPLDEPAR